MADNPTWLVPTLTILMEQLESIARSQRNLDQLHRRREALIMTIWSKQIGDSIDTEMLDKDFPLEDYSQGDTNG